MHTFELKFLLKKSFSSNSPLLIYPNLDEHDKPIFIWDFWGEYIIKMDNIEITKNRKGKGKYAGDYLILLTEDFLETALRAYKRENFLKQIKIEHKEGENIIYRYEEISLIDFRDSAHKMNINWINENNLEISFECPGGDDWCNGHISKKIIVSASEYIEVIIKSTKDFLNQLIQINPRLKEWEGYQDLENKLIELETLKNKPRRTLQEES